MKENHSFRIAFVTCYFGQVPWYVNFFIKSCAFNPDIDFFIVGDMSLKIPLPPNVKQVIRSVDQLRQQMESRLGIQVKINDPYKLCDFKPAYGIIFEELLTGYDFWGHCDIDLIFGDIRGFITATLLHNHDVICVREEYVTGFFSLFRNTPVINRLYEQSKDYELVFRSAEHLCFDECNFAWVPLMHGLSIFDVKTAIESMTHVVKRLAAEGKIRACFNFMVIEGLCGDLEWDRGILTYAKRAEALLYHLIKFKKQSDLIVPRWEKIPDRFFIHTNHFTT